MDYIRPTPRNPIYGLLADQLEKLYSPTQTQQMQGLMRLLMVPEVSKTMNLLAYGEPLTTGAGGIGGTTKVKPEVLDAAMAVAPFAPVAGRAARGTAQMVGQEMADRLTTGRSMLPSMLAEPKSAMFAVEPNVRNVKTPYPQQASIEAAQRNAENIGQSVEAYPRSLQQGYEHGWYHGSTGDIKSFNPSLLGEATGAASAKKGFFFARDPQNPPSSMVNDVADKDILQFLQQGGLTPEEIAQSATMAGHGAETASGYAQIGGSREYRDAMRKAKSAEKRGDWDEYEKQMQIAEDSEINRMNYAQSMVAKYGDARDEMLETIKNTIYNKKLSQEEANALDKKYMELMPYGWYNSFEPKQFNQLKKQLVNLVGQDAATPALSQIDNFKSIKAERMAVENTQQGGNVMPVALRYENPMVYDFQGSAYRDQTYSDLIDQALSGGHDALILKNTFDPGGGPAKLVDVGVVFDPSQIRSRFAAFDPFRKDVATATAMGVALPDLLAAEPTPQPQSSGLLYPFP